MHYYALFLKCAHFLSPSFASAPALRRTFIYSVFSEVARALLAPPLKKQILKQPGRCAATVGRTGKCSGDSSAPENTKNKCAAR